MLIIQNYFYTKKIFHGIFCMKISELQQYTDTLTDCTVAGVPSSVNSSIPLRPT